MCGEAEAKAEDALAKSTEAASKYEDCMEAAARANEAADAAFAAEQNVRDGGYIESLKEMNKGGKFKVWVGTQDEYYGSAATQNNTFCIITDDAEGEKLRTDIASVQKQCDDMQKQLSDISQSLPDEVAEMLERLEYISAAMRDYVCDVGTDEGWNYRRWNSGYFEAEYDSLIPDPNTACSEPLGEIYLDNGFTRVRCPYFVETITSISNNIYYDFHFDDGHRAGISGAFVTDDGVIDGSRYLSYRMWANQRIDYGVGARIMIKISGYYK